MSSLDRLPEIAWTVGADGQFRCVNERGRAFLEPRTGSRPDDWLPLVHPEELEPMLAKWKECSATLRPFELVLRLFHRRIGEYRWFLARASWNPEGETGGWWGTLCDVDRLKRSEIALVAADRCKDEFFATLSHELRSPLNVIMGYCQLFGVLKPGTPEFSGAIEKIHRAARVQLQLISDLLDVSRIINGKMKLTIGPVSLPRLAAAAEESVRLAARHKGVQIKISLETDVELIEGEFVRLQQVLWNLLSNAVKFSPSNGIVELIIREWEQRGEHIELVVKDSGEGIGADVIEHVFDRLWQGGPKARRKEGLGLGLAIVRHLAELHGGSVTCESEGKNKGATFIVRLPKTQSTRIGPEPEMVPTISRPSQPSASLGGQPLRGLTVLVVDDEPDSRDVVGNALRSAGAIVETAGSAQQALGSLERRQPSLLFGDIGMPQKDGCQLMREWRAIERERQLSPVPAVALSAFARKADSAAAIAAGYDCFLPKPVEIANLIATAVGLASGTRNFSSINSGAPS